jgi:enoyl-CoA hydratase/carnithine racemase
VTRKGPVTINTLSRPEVYNALHIGARVELNKVFDDFSTDPEWVAIVTAPATRRSAPATISNVAAETAAGTRAALRPHLAFDATNRSSPPSTGVGWRGLKSRWPRPHHRI